MTMTRILAVSASLFAASAWAQLTCIDGAPITCPANLCCGNGCEVCHPDNTNMWMPGDAYTCPNDYPVDCGNGRCCPSNLPACCPQAMCAATQDACNTTGQCPTDHPRFCGNNRCCDAAHPNCCGDSCCDPQHPFCCGDGQCCDAAHPFCCGGGVCAATQAQCPNNCPRGYTMASGVNGATQCCPAGFNFACGDGSCDSNSFCHGAGPLGAATPTGGGTGGSGGGGPFVCSASNPQVQCSDIGACSKCSVSSCGGPNGSACAFYKASDGSVFGNTCNADQSCTMSAATAALQHCGCI
jgi:hypothetical protein